VENITTYQGTNLAAHDAALAAINFDTTPEAEEAAIQALADELSPRYVIVEKSLAVKFPTGHIIKISLDVPFEEFEKIVERDGDDSQQFKEILAFLGKDRELEIIKGQGSIAVMSLAQKYFTTWNKVVGASLGESSGSGLSA